MRDRWLGLTALVIAGCVINPAFDAVTTDGEVSSSSGGVTGGETEPEPGTPLSDPCPPLGAPEGTIVNVTPERAAELQEILDAAQPGTTVLLAPGTYPVADGLWVGSPETTVRSSTGNPADVVLDANWSATAIFTPRAANITIAEMTLHRAAQHAVHISGSAQGPAPGFLGYRLVMSDAGAAAFKVNPSPEEFPADDGTLACSSISVSDETRQQLGDSCREISGFSGIATHGWHLRDNTVEQIWCPTGFVGSAIRFVESSADVIIERNVIRDCANGIILGVHEDGVPRREYAGERCDGGYYDHYGGLIVNNVVTATGTGIASSEYGLDAGIGLWQVCNATVVHNTVASAIGAFSSIEYRFARTQARVVNNLVTDEIRDRDDAGVPIAGNLQQVDLSNFVDPLGGDVHLLPDSEAVDAGVLLGDDAVLHDLDGDPRTDPPDVGADEMDL